jgi:hypothetical protein
MSNFLQPSMNNHSDYNNEQASQQTDLTMRQLQIEITENDTTQNQARLESLMTAGFSWDESVNLLRMREHVYENVEVRQRIENDPRVQFVRWLIENGEMNER